MVGKITDLANISVEEVSSLPIVNTHNQVNYRTRFDTFILQKSNDELTMPLYCETDSHRIPFVWQCSVFANIDPCKRLFRYTELISFTFETEISRLRGLR